MTPYALELCETLSLPHLYINDTFTPEEYYAAKERSETSIRSLIASLNDLSRKEPASDGFRFEIGHYFYFQLYVIIGTLHFRAFLFDRLLRTVAPSAIISFRSSKTEYKEAWPDPIAGDMNTELLCGSPYAGKLTVLDYDSSAGEAKGRPNFKARIRIKLRNFIFSSPWRNEIYSRLDHFRKGIRPIWLQKQKDKIKLLAVGPLYNWRYVLKSTAAEAFAVDAVREMGFTFTYRPENSGSPLLEKTGWKAEFSGFEIGRMISGHFSTIERFFAHIQRTHSVYRKKIERFDHVIFSALVFAVQNYIAHLARSLNKGVFCYQHGEMNLYRDALASEACELLYPTHYFSFGSGVNGKYEPYIGRPLEQVIAVGSASIEKCTPSKKSDDKGEGVVLYATAKYILNVTPFINSIDLDRRLYRTQKFLLAYFENVMNEHPDVQVVFKPNNTYMHNQTTLTFEKVKVSDAYNPFSQLIHQASAIVLDSPATTALEASTTNKPIFALLSRMQWFPEAEALFSKRAVTAKSPEELAQKMDRFFKNGEYPADVNNREFVRAYATAEDDGRAAQRVAEFIRTHTRKKAKV